MHEIILARPQSMQSSQPHLISISTSHDCLQVVLSVISARADVSGGKMTRLSHPGAIKVERLSHLGTGVSREKYHTI